MTWNKGESSLVNYHFHSQCSFDAEYPLTEMCRAAQAAGITHLCLTDHCDVVDEQGKPWDGFDWNAEDRELQAARQAFPALDIRRGVELGQAILRPEAADRVLSEPGIDFVLGSMHNSRSGTDFYYMQFTDKRQCLNLLQEYLEGLLELAGTDWLDSLAHLTYPIRYMRARDGVAVDFHPLDDLVYEILKKLVERGKALELNTSGYRRNQGEPLPPEYMLRMYRELGGDLITIGSDAHEPGHMHDGLEQGMALLQRCGFRYVTLYQNRKPQQMKMEEVI